jgi:nucleotide-binding universal stress UspA family protein
MKRILVPCDFSDTAMEAFKFAIDITQQTKGELHVLHVLDMTFLGGSPSLSHAYAFNVEFLRDLEKETEEKFTSMRERFSPWSPGVKFHYQVGSLLQETTNFIDQYMIDLVVMGTSGTNQSKWGSNAEKLVRYSTVPVIAIRTNPSRPIKKIIVPINIAGEPNIDFVEEVKKLQTFFDAQLMLLYINTPLFFMKDRAIQNKLDKFAERFTLSNYQIFFRSDTTIQEGIANFLRESHADMLAMGTHAWKGFGHFIFGSVTEDVVNQLAVPIWTYVID